MKWTVGQRITVGYAVILVLLVVVAGVGYNALSRTAGNAQNAARWAGTWLQAQDFIGKEGALSSCGQGNGCRNTRGDAVQIQ